jgi:signal transduction histidine kinase
VEGVVHGLGYAGAMVATLENGRALPVRAYAVDVAPETITAVEEAVGIRLLSEQAVVYLDDPQYQDNLSVRAVAGLNGRPEKYLVSAHLGDLFYPLVSLDLADQAQQLLGIKQVIAVPFFQADEIVGNLFVTSRKALFSDWEISLLTALGQHAAAGLKNARLYREMSEQRRIAQTFGRMAFSTVASAHSLRNHVGNISGYMQLLQMLPQLSAERRDFIFRELPIVTEEIAKIVNILDNLNEPWQQATTDMVNVNDSLSRALVEIFPRTPLFRNQPKIVTETKITVHLDLVESLPLIKTSKDMLAEALRIIIKNAVEALAGVDRSPQIWLKTRQISDQSVEVCIRDNGPGIPKENLGRIFEMGWTTKKGSGMGFGLFWTRDFVDGLGGKLTVTSTVDQGTTFVVTLPVTAVPPPSPTE